MLDIVKYTYGGVFYENTKKKVLVLSSVILALLLCVSILSIGAGTSYANVNPFSITEEDPYTPSDYSNFNFYAITGGYAVSLANFNATELKIPRKYIDGQPVLEISTNGFLSATNLKTVYIPSSIVKVNNSAFMNCTNLEKVRFFSRKNNTTGTYSGVQTIGSLAFNSCTSLKNILIPKSITSVSSTAFRYCYTNIINRSTLNITQGSTFYGTIENNSIKLLTSSPTGVSTFRSLGTCVIDSYQMLSLNGQEYEIPVMIDGNLVIGIEACAFEECEAERVYFADEFHQGGQNVFLETMAFGYTDIKNIELGNFVTFATDATGIFSDSKLLESVLLPNNLTLIPKNTFDGCISLKTLLVDGIANTIPSTVDYIGSQAFKNCLSMEEIIIPAADYVEYAVFENWTDAQAVEVDWMTRPNGWAENWDYSCNSNRRYNDSNYTYEVKADNSKTSIYKYKGAATSVTIPTGSVYNVPITSIADSAFKDSNIKTVSIQSNITTVGNNVFENCTSLTSVTLPTQLKTITDLMFANCTSLSSINLSSVKSIGIEAFLNCTNLKYLLVGNVTSIGDMAFNGWTSSQFIQIEILSSPGGTWNTQTNAKIEYIGGYNFSLNSDGTYSISGISRTGTITVPTTYNQKNITKIGDGYSSTNCQATTVTLGSNIKTIDAYAFQNSSVRAVNWGGVTTIGNYAFAGSSIGYVNTGIGWPDTSFALPSNLTKLGNYAFNNCAQLKRTVYVNSALTEIGNYAFANSAIIGLVFSGSGSDYYPEPSVNLTKIGDSAFYNCTQLAGYVKIPLSVTSLGSQAFSGTNKITELYVYAYLPTVGANVCGSWTASKTIIFCGYTGIISPINPIVPSQWNGKIGTASFILTSEFFM